MSKGLLAIAIEDRVDFWFQYTAENQAVATATPSLIKIKSRTIPESGDYFDSVFKLITELFNSLLLRLAELREIDQLNSIASIVVSVPGVVDNNQILLQIPLWNSFSNRPPIKFPEELLSIAEAAILRHGLNKWPKDTRLNFLKAVYVVNDATACAAFEYTKLKPEERDFIYIKLHNGINAGVVQRLNSGKFVIKIAHPEAGHSFPVPHKLDNDATYSGACRYHGFCFEGMVSLHSLYDRAVNTKGPTFESWKRHIEALAAQNLHGQELDKALLKIVLNEHIDNTGRTGLGISLIAHYVAQLVFQLALSPLAPEYIVLGGRMAKPAILKQIRKNILLWANGYPQRSKLMDHGIDKFIVRTNAETSEKHQIEVHGALIIAMSRDDSRDSYPDQAQMSRNQTVSAKQERDSVIYLKDYRQSDLI